MWKKTVLTLFAALILETGISAAPRDSVVIVRPNVPTETQKTFLSIADYFNQIGEPDAVTFMKAYTQGGHGSGFAVKLSDGSVVVITNRHVAGNALTAEIVIEDGDNNQKSIPDCPVVYVDDAVDIALISLPKGTTISALTLADTVPNDGTDVWSAGYPGLIDRPSWQLAKGNITNRNVSVPEMGEPKNDSFVQHSALIDPGNSGGPLFVGDPSRSETIKVVGVNTWTMRDRSNTFFAIPVNKLAEALSRYMKIRKDSADPAVALQKSCQDFVTFINGAEWGKFDYLRLYATSSATAGIWDEMIEEFRTMNKKDRQVWIDRFFTSPTDTLRQFNSWEMWHRAHESTGELEFVSLQGSDFNAVVPVRFSLSGKDMNTVWVYESGRWLFQSESGKVAAPSAVKKTQGAGSGERKGKGYGGITPSGIGVFLGIGLAPGNAQESSALAYSGGLNFEGEVFNQFTRTFFLRVGENFMLKGDDPLYTKDGKLAGFGFGTGLNYYFPFYKDSSFFAPYIGAGLGVCLNMFTRIETNYSANSDESTVFDNMFDLYVFPRLGAEFSFDGSSAFGVSASLNYGLLGMTGLRTIPIEAYYKYLLE